jgi:hypothetical protein
VLDGSPQCDNVERFRREIKIAYVPGSDREPVVFPGIPGGIFGDIEAGAAPAPFLGSEEEFPAPASDVQQIARWSKALDPTHIVPASPNRVLWSPIVARVIFCVQQSKFVIGRPGIHVNEAAFPAADYPAAILLKAQFLVLRVAQVARDVFHPVYLPAPRLLRSIPPRQDYHPVHQSVNAQRPILG